MALRGVKGQGPFPSETPAPQRTEASAFRESPGFEKQLTQPQGRRPKLHDRASMEGQLCWMTCFLLLVFSAGSSFSTLRKKQRGPEGAAEFSPGRLPPLDSPRLSNPVLARSSSPLQRTRGGAPLLDFFLISRCAAPLYGVAALVELRVLVVAGFGLGVILF